MSEPQRKIEAIQRWMQTVITHYGGVERGVDSDEARGILGIDPAEVESVILPSRRVWRIERFEVCGKAS